MSLVINTNTAATAASVNLRSSNMLLQKSLSRLSSGIRITSPADDAGGLAVSMKMSAAIRRTDAVNNNVGNAVSFLQTQDGGLKTSGEILDRISEIRTLYSDVTKNANDKANYETEFDQMNLPDASVGVSGKENLFSTTVLTDADPPSACPVPKRISPPSPNSLSPQPSPRNTLNSRIFLPRVPPSATAPS